MHADLPIPAPAHWPASWCAGAPTDTPVLRNDLWDAIRSIPRGLWSVAIYSGHDAPRLLATQDYAVDDFGDLHPLGPDQAEAGNHWQASGDNDLDIWADMLPALTAGSPLHTMAQQARATSRPSPTLPTVDANPVQARQLAEAASPWYAASLQVDDDLDWQPGQPLYSVEVQHDDLVRLVLTRRQARALGAALLALAATACGGGGGGDEGDQPRPAAPCAARAEVCR